MPSKTEEYLALAQRTANGLTRYWESWTDYLTTASRLYKYPFADQLMIYAQRPDATDCADFDIWNNRMNRYVRRGAKGIALLDESSGFPRLHYVFDVSDTGVRRNSRDPEVWQYNDDLKQPVSEMLSKTYGISGERVSQQLADVAGKLVADYWDNNGEDIRAIVDGSLLMDYDEAGVEMQFKSAAAISVTYTLLERCGFEPAGWFDKDDFQAVYNFSTPDSVYALGAAVSDMSREVLRNIERTVKTTIRRRNAERSQYEYEQQERDLLDRRGLPAPEPDPASAEDPAGQVRQAAPDVLERPSPGAVQHDAPEREPVPAPDGGGADGREPDAADHEAASETEPGPGQGAESDGMGAAHEQPAGTGRGTGADGIDLQLSFFDAHIPTEVQQIEKIDQAESEKTPSAFSLSQAEIENELRKHGSGFMGGKQRIMALYQTQPDRNLRAKALAKEYGIGGHSHDFLDGSRGFVNHDGKGLEFDHYPDHQKITLKWTQVEKYIDLMIQSDRYLTDKEKEHYTPPVPITVEPDATLTHAKNLIRDFCLEEYDSEPDFSNLSKIGIAYTNATDEEIPIQVNVDLVGYRVERYLGEVLIDERQYESLEELTETELEALDFSELVSVTDEELEHYHSKAEERPALLPLDAATEYNALKEQHPDALVGFEQGGQFEFYGEDARRVCELLGGKFLEKETALGTVPVISFPCDQWAYRAKQLWQRGETVYLAGLNEDGTHYQTKYLRREDYLPLGAIVHMEGRSFRVDTVNFDKGSVTLQDVALAEMRIPVFREEPLALVRELYEEQDMMESPLPDYKVGDNVVVELPTRTIEGKVGYVGETDVRIDTSAQGQSWDNEVINKRQFEDGFETTDRRDFYDLAVGNVPFGQYKVNDKAYNKLGFSIHNYFFAKAIDQVRPGGIVAFVTSRYTMDSKDSTARKHIAERADLLGAIRLPNNAFKANAGTDVVSDIIFLQKRDRPIDHEPDWVQLGKTEDGFAINQYFADHPEMVLGVLSTESTQYGREELTVAPLEGISLADQLAEAVQHIEGQYTAAEVDTPDIAEEEAARRTLPADPEVKNFSYTVVDGEVFYRENSVMTQVELSDTAKGRVTGMVELRQIVNDLIDQQLNDYPDEDIKASQAKLNAAYDAFTAKYGLLNDRKNGRLFEQDSSYYLLCSLENLDEQGQLKSKAAMFTKRTIRPERTVTSVDTPSEALAVSIGEHGKVDLPYMAELLGTPGEYGRITTELSGVIFKDPAADPTDPEAGWQMADEYLSGDVRAKLRMAQFAAETNPEFVVNVDALTKAQPRELEASEIDVRLGATWLNPDIIQKFMTETFQIPYYLRHAVKVTQLLFCDLSTPKNDGNFNVYDDIRKKLVAAGVPENEIEFIHNADTEAKKAALFSKVRSGDVRVLLGSTAKMGAGTNVQSRLVAVHHLDVGWKPSDMTQRNGRIIRQGNMNKEVKVLNYVTEGTFDSYLFQTLENKQRFISQIMTSKSPVRSCEDVDEQALSYAEIKALCAGNPLIKEKMDLDVQVAKLKVLKADHQSQKFRLQDKLLTKFPADIQEANAHIAGLKADAQLAAAHPQGKEDFCGITIKGVAYDEKKTAGERLVLACSELPNAEEKVIGSYRGFEMSLRFDAFRTEYQALLKGQRKYTVPLGTDPLGNIIRLDNSLNSFPERITAAENELATLYQQQEAAQIEVEKPFPQEEELAEKSARLAELNAQLDVDEKSHDPEQDEEEQEDEPRRPSVLAALEEKSDKPEPVKPFRSYYDKDGDAR